jgi:spore maturation protein CgeB
MIKRVLFVSNSYEGYSNDHILEAFQSREDVVLNVLYSLPLNYKDTIRQKIFHKCKVPLDLNGLNKDLLKEVEEHDPEIIFIVKGVNVYPRTLKKIKMCNKNSILVSWSLDDMYARHNRSFYYTKGLKYYDHVFTTKSYNVAELKSLGARNVSFLYQAYSRYRHLNENLDMTEPNRRDVSFVGYADEIRFRTILFLANNGVKVEVAGGTWKKFKSRGHENISIHARDLIEEEYSDFICSSKINLGLLRKINRDLHTSRSVEIPACGGFLLAERTAEHDELFEDNVEAVFFDDDQDLLRLVRHYLLEDKQRDLIRMRGLKRCRDSNYSYDKMVDIILSKVV